MKRFLFLSFLVAVLVLSSCQKPDVFEPPVNPSFEAVYSQVDTWGSTGSGNGEFINPGEMFFFNNKIYVYEKGNSRVQIFNTSGKLLKKLDLTITRAFSATPGGITVDIHGNVYIVQRNESILYKYDSTGTFVNKWTLEVVFGKKFVAYLYPKSITTDNKGHLYIVGDGEDAVYVYTTNGAFVQKFGVSGQGNGEFSSPSGIDIDRQGFIYITDTGNYRVQKFDSNHKFITKWGSQGDGDGEFQEAWKIYVDHLGYVYVTDAQRDCVQKFTPNGDFLGSWGSTGTGNNQFHGPSGVAVDYENNVYVSDTFNDRVIKFSGEIK
ncbi:6-bladed beta-propeller [Candidatus Dependentiae bacterium]|nr:6-bladed beta-propeller [Candidatus Dependentiae bacterium]